MQPAVCRHRQNLSGHNKAANRYAKIKTQITSRKMLPSMLLLSLLQPVATAHVRERHRKKANRHQYKRNVLHQLNLRDNAVAHFRRA